MIQKITLALFAFLFVANSSYAQQDVPNGWHLLSPTKDSFYGIDLAHAYKFLKDILPMKI
jgi:hypothetical protein